MPIDDDENTDEDDDTREMRLSDEMETAVVDAGENYFHSSNCVCYDTQVSGAPRCRVYVQAFKVAVSDEVSKYIRK